MQTKPLTTETIDRILTALRTGIELADPDLAVCLDEYARGCDALAADVQREVLDDKRAADMSFALDLLDKEVAVCECELSAALSGESPGEAKMARDALRAFSMAAGFLRSRSAVIGVAVPARAA